MEVAQAMVVEVEEAGRVRLELLGLLVLGVQGVSLRVLQRG